jgi:hypothetical protein
MGKSGELHALSSVVCLDNDEERTLEQLSLEEALRLRQQLWDAVSCNPEVRMEN